MPRFLVLALLALALPAWADDAPYGGREAIRHRRLQADRAQERVHYAVEFTITKDGSSLRIRGECYVEGDRAGVRLRRIDENGEDLMGCLSLVENMPVSWEGRNPGRMAWGQRAAAEPTLAVAAFGKAIREALRSTGAGPGR